MDILLVSLVALLASGLTLFSGFGLGTLLMPVVALFFPLELAIGMTAVVHLANNLFKLGLLGRLANGRVVLLFGLPAIAAAVAGAIALAWLSDAAPLLSYEAFGRPMQVPALNLVVGGLILVFVALELWPRFAQLALDRRYLPLGGLVSGFLGGLSGHQGALRSMFLLKAGLDKQQFVATGVVLAVLVDLARLAVYGVDLSARAAEFDWRLVGAASAAALAGAYFGAKLLGKVTIDFIRYTVSALLVLVGVGLVTGVL